MKFLPIISCIIASSAVFNTAGVVASSTVASLMMLMIGAISTSEATYSYSTTCESAMKSSSPVLGKFSRPKVIYNTAGKLLKNLMK
jgi:hypothetical protein